MTVVAACQRLQTRKFVRSAKKKHMEIHEIKTVINSIKENLRAKYEIDWLEYTLNYSESKKDFYRCEVYISQNSEIRSDYVYIRIDNNSEMIKKSFELLVKSVLYEVRK